MNPAISRIPCPGFPFHQFAILTLMIFGLCIPVNDTCAQSDSAWSLAETDCQISGRNWLVSKSLDEIRSAPDSDRIHFKTSWGTKVLVSKKVDPAWVIDELQPSLWVKASRPQIQLFARVVLPRTNDPMETGPMTVLLPGPVYQNAGRWQKLDFRDLSKKLPELLEESVWKLRAKFDQPVDAGEAYLDKLVLNIYTGTGSSTVWIDDIEIGGAIQATAAHSNSFRRDSMVRPVGFSRGVNQEFADGTNRRPALTRTSSTILEVRGQPFFARSIQHNGEPFERLRELGFNTIELAQTATIQQLRHAERLDMWIVCPPPGSAGLQPISAEFDRVLAWSMGNDLDSADIERINTRKREVEQSDFREDRPVIAFASTGLFELSRASDILGVGLEPIGGSFILSQYSDWLQQRVSLSQKSLPVWASMQTEVARSVRKQTAALAPRVPPMPLEANQMKFMAYEAIAGGARGLRFLSRTRLDAEDPVSNLHRISLAWLNAHLRQLEPWVSGGAVVNRSVSNDRAEQVTTLATPRAKLMLIQRASQMEQLVAGESPVSDFLFSDPSLGASEGAYHLSESGMIPLDQGRSIAGNEIKIENCGAMEAVVITQDPTVINRLAESYMISGSETLAQMHLEIARQWMTIVQLINDQLTRMGRAQPAASGSINEANNALRQAQALVANGSAMTANRLLFVADQKLAVARRNILSTARSPFVSQTSSPLLTHISLVPLHFELISRINPHAWQPNGLAGGDFENLQHMTNNQWENHRTDDDSLQTQVELTTSTVIDGKRALMMTVAPSQAGMEDSVIDRTPLWVKSSAVPVRAGQLVRIHGWVNVAKPVIGSLDGLMIIDSIGGTEMAERINVTRGWQEFSIYRCPALDTDVQVTFALTGYGQILVDEVDIRVLDLNASVRQARNE